MTEMNYRSEPEETIFIDLPNTDGLKIKGILRGSFDQPLAVIVHGLPGTGNELLPYLSARYLYEQGIASLRLFMYDSEPYTRDLIDCTLPVHVTDFDTVIDYLRSKKVKQVFAIGHSYGGLTILRSKSKLDGAVLWDPTHGEVFHKPESVEWRKNSRQKRVDDLILYLDGWGYIEPKAIDDEQKIMGDTTNLAADKGYPLKIVAAGKGIMTELQEKYINAANEPKKLTVIKDGSHQFDDSDDVVLRLFEETSSWFKRHI